MRTLPVTIIAAALTTVTILAACNNGAGEPVTTYTYGPLSQTGVLVSTGVSLVRRGTHVLYADGKAAYFLESKVRNLQEFSGKRVFVQGDLQPNVHPKYLPVLVVTDATPIEHKEGLREWKLPALSLTFQAPESWQGIAAERSVSLLASDATGSGTVFMLDTIEANGLPEGIPAVVAGSVAVKMRTPPPNGEEIHILRGGQVIRITFTPGKEALDTQRLQYAALLASMTFAASASSASSATGSGSAVQQPCGGPAGILCPAGQYCDVFDAQENIGKCRQR